MARLSGEGLRVVVCLFLVLFVGVADNQIVSPLLPAIRAQLGKSTQEASILFTGYSLSAGLSVLIWGPLSDLFGCKRGLLTGLAVFVLGSSISFLSFGYFSLLTGRVVTGMGASMLSLNTISYAADYFPYARRGLAMSSIFSSYFAALILGVPLLSLLGDALGWSAVFGITGALALLLLASTYWLLPSVTGQPRSTVSDLFLFRQVSTYFQFLKTRSTLGALLSSFFASAGMMGFLAFVGVWLHDSFGITGKQVGLIFLASGTAALLASPWAGALSDRIGKRFQFVISSLALAVLLVCLPQLRWGIPLFLVFAAVSLAAAFRQGPMEALTTEVVPAGLRGSFIALKNSFSQLGIGAAALTSGILFEVGGYAAVCLFCAALSLAAAGSMFLLVRQANL
jgi:predicted MFS family arabinose efflux permease